MQSIHCLIVEGEKRMQTIAPDEPCVETDRLLLRNWQDQDREPFIALNQDADVMRYFPRIYMSEESEAFMNKQQALIATNGYGLFSVSLKETSEFIGFIGYAVPGFNAAFMPCVEIGWRLKRSVWGRGYAPEGACALINSPIPRPQDPLVSLTAAINHPSRRVMEKIGFVHNPEEDFLHPLLDAKSPLAVHVLYRKKEEM